MGATVVGGTTVVVQVGEVQVGEVQVGLYTVDTGTGDTESGLTEYPESTGTVLQLQFVHDVGDTETGETVIGAVE